MPSSIINSDDGVISGTSGLKSSGGDDGVLVFQSKGTECGEFDASGNFQFNSGYGSVATAYGCRAWVNFNGTGVVAIRASGNVSSITDNGTGNYTVNFTTAMPDANYSMVLTSGGTSTSLAARIDNPASLTTTSAGPILCVNTSFSVLDQLFVMVAIFR